MRNRPSLDEWTSWQAEGWDQHSLIADPMFVDWQKMTSA